MARQYFAIDIAYTPEVISRLMQNNAHSNVIYLQDLGQYFAQFPSREQALFLCMDVLEHLENENEILSELQPETGNYFYLPFLLSSLFFRGTMSYQGIFAVIPCNSLKNSYRPVIPG